MGHLTPNLWLSTTVAGASMGWFSEEIEFRYIGDFMRYVGIQRQQYLGWYKGRFAGPAHVSWEFIHLYVYVM